MSFWEKTVNTPANVQAQEMVAENAIVLDEEAVAVIQGDMDFDVFEDEEENTAELMLDANLRLEQGRLYQMVIQNDIFAQTNADPRAIKNVQREIRKFVIEKMETMLGIRQELKKQVAVISSPFNDMEVTALKMLASKITNGATQQESHRQDSLPVQPKKDGITAISGALRPNAPLSVSRPLNKEAKPVTKTQSPKPVSKSAITKSEEDFLLKKPIEEMTTEELAEHDRQALERRAKNKATLPSNMMPHPSPQEMEMRYTMQASQIAAPGSAAANIMALMAGKK